MKVPIPAREASGGPSQAWTTVCHPRSPIGGGGVAGSWAEATQLPLNSYMACQREAGKPACLSLTKTFLPRCLLFQFPHLSIHSHSPSAPSCFLQIKTPRLPVCAGAGSQQAPDAQERHRQRVPRGAHDFFKQEARGLLTPGEGPGKGGRTILQHWLQGGSRCSGSWEQFGKTIGQPHSSEPLSDRHPGEPHLIGNKS